jgi:hypothetical protein
MEAGGNFVKGKAAGTEVVAAPPVLFDYPKGVAENLIIKLAPPTLPMLLWAAIAAAVV